MFYRRLLLSPPPSQLVASLLDATEAANRGTTILGHGQGYWESFVEEWAGSREGRRQWSDTHRGDTAHVGIAWWTDHVGRRHVSVTAGNSRDRSHRFPAPARNDPRPPLWHLYPDRVFYREKQGTGEWWAVCACGTAGRPEALAWMGERCGPCHDRLEEGQRLAEDVPSGVRKHHGAGKPAFSPDGRLLAVVVDPQIDQDSVRVHDLAEGTERILSSSTGGPLCLAFSPDGSLLACNERATEVRIHDLSANESTVVFEEDFPVARLAFAPDGRTLAVGGETGWHLWRRTPASSNWRQVCGGDRGVTALAFSADGQRLALGGHGWLGVVGVAQGDASHEADGDFDENSQVDDIGFQGDGDHLASVWWSLFGPNELRLFEPADAGPRQIARHELTGAGRAYLSTDGRLLAAFARQVGVVQILDATTGTEIGRVGWDVKERLHHAVLSPDGGTLALVDRHGTLKLMPWSLLLA